MPVGKVFNAAENQVLISPVTSYYQGKAIRLAQRNSELSNQALEQEIEMADDKLALEERRVATEEKNVELREQEYAQKASEYADKVGKDKALEEANTIIGITEGAKASDDPLAYANERMPEFIATLPEGEGRAKLEQMAQDGFQAEEMKELYAFSMAVNKKFNSGADAPATGKMAEGLSMGLEPGTPEWEEWIRGGDKELAAETKAEMVYELLNENTFRGKPVDEETKRAILDSLNVEIGAKGSITLKWDDAEDMAESIMDRTGIQESGFFTLKRNNEEFENRLAASLMRLFKDGRFGGKELEERALADAIGADWDEVLQAQEEKNATLPEDEQFTVMDILKILAKE
jgi:hypothetical protein